MNTYIIPITCSYGHNYEYYAAIFAENQNQAFMAAKQFHQNRMIQPPPYETYNEELELSKYVFHESEKSDILFSSLIFSKENKHMAFFQVNWKKYTDKLAEIAAPENWSNNTYKNNGILTNYILNTYGKLSSEKKIIIAQDYALFNTGLFTKYYEPIYAYQSGVDIQFLTSYELSNLGIPERPERANYFEKPELLLFDWHFPIDVQYRHILEDEKNRDRLPQELLNSNNLVTIMNGAIDTMKKKVSSNYKLAIPQYYDGKIQLLLPLCLQDDNKPDVAIVVTKKEHCYQGHTCLSLDMAYNNARLIAKPAHNWLSAN